MWFKQCAIQTGQSYEIQGKLKVIAEQVQNDNAVQDHRLDNILFGFKPYNFRS